jgi:hypothetical protein
MDENEIGELDECGPSCDEVTIGEGDFAAILNSEAFQGGMAAIEHPEVENVPVTT